MLRKWWTRLFSTPTANNLPIPSDTETSEDEDPRRSIEYLQTDLRRKYGMAPVFFVGTLEEAANAAFLSDSIKDSRSLLIYLHQDDSVIGDLFCSEIFCKKVLDKYLLENFIVWPWNITSRNNKLRLWKWWREIFPDLNLLDLFVGNFPLLIGVMQHASGERRRFSPFDYHAQALQRGDLLIKPQKISRMENVLDVLRSFRQECHRHQQFLVAVDVTEATGMCLDVLVEITKYLSLADAINAFSMSILPVLRQAHSKIHLHNPPYRFVQMIGQYLDPRQIASVYINDNVRRPTRDLSAFHMFDQLVSVTVFSQKGYNAIGSLLHYFPTACYISLWFASEFDTALFLALRNVSSLRMTHLRIRCTGVRFLPFHTGKQQGGSSKNTTITSFIFDSTYKTTNPSDRPVHGLPQMSPLVKLPIPMKFIAFLRNVRQVRLIVDEDQAETFLEVDQWQQLISECVHLQRVTIQLLDEGHFTQQAVSIEQMLCHIRPGIRFRIKST